MLIPPRCFTCGEVIADKWDIYIRTINERKNKSTENLKNNDLNVQFIDVNDKVVKKSIEGQVLDDMGVHKYCCRIPFLSTAHLITTI
jgi:DNA-directed RNA polymerase subunit N